MAVFASPEPTGLSLSGSTVRLKLRLMISGNKMPPVNSKSVILTSVPVVFVTWERRKIVFTFPPFDWKKKRKISGSKLYSVSWYTLHSVISLKVILTFDVFDVFWCNDSYFGWPAFSFGLRAMPNDGLKMNFLPIEDIYILLVIDTLKNNTILLSIEYCIWICCLCMIDINHDVSSFVLHSPEFIISRSTNIDLLRCCNGIKNRCSLCTFHTTWSILLVTMISPIFTAKCASNIASFALNSWSAIWTSTCKCIQNLLEYKSNNE